MHCIVGQLWAFRLAFRARIREGHTGRKQQASPLAFLVHGHDWASWSRSDCLGQRTPDSSQHKQQPISQQHPCPSALLQKRRMTQVTQLWLSAIMKRGCGKYQNSVRCRTAGAGSCKLAMVVLPGYTISFWLAFSGCLLNSCLAMPTSMLHCTFLIYDADRLSFCSAGHWGILWALLNLT